MSRHDHIPADTLRQSLDYAETVCTSRDFHLFHEIEGRRVDFRLIAAKLIDAGAPIADWRNDPRTLAVRIPGELPVFYVGNARCYGGEAAETLHAVRREYEKRLIDWFMADTAPVPVRSDEGRVAAWLIHHMPSVEDYVDAAPVGLAA